MILSTSKITNEHAVSPDTVARSSAIIARPPAATKLVGQGFSLAERAGTAATLKGCPTNAPANIHADMSSVAEK